MKRKFSALSLPHVQKPKKVKTKLLFFESSPLPISAGNFSNMRDKPHEQMRMPWSQATLGERKSRILLRRYPDCPILQVIYKIIVRRWQRELKQYNPNTNQQASTADNIQILEGEPY